ncbi:glycosyl hydrolase [Mucilaginibacter pedocola]|uniref:Glycoside hydrolase n=1 Tax=Mucilaginibacter pedocola TaxID=1792845 RepID=A0A1S9PLI5_9SPHI|nr:glycosyl hydrolase [Mucilaginibacter pedocola]OOQ61408.1 glycoside hydrolase [Mucilaginibacter pedocola]
MKKYLTAIIIFLKTTCFFSNAEAQQKTDTLYQNFVSPPAVAKPRVWWHWMNGNITKEGIHKDLAWMKSAGIAGFQNFDAAMTTPQRVEKRLIYMTPEWQDAFRYTTRLADSLKLEMAIAGSPGWSQSGGPWVPPQDGMKKYVWSETFVTGGKTIHQAIPKPPAITGPFQNIPYTMIPGLDNPTNRPTPQYAKDIKVIAYKLPDSGLPIRVLKPAVTVSGGNFNLEQLTDGDLTNTAILPKDTISRHTWIRFAFERPVTIYAVTGTFSGQNAVLEKSDNGTDFQSISKVPSSGAQVTIAFPATTARYYRLSFNAEGAAIAELALHTSPHVNKFEQKAAFSIEGAVYEDTASDTTGMVDPKMVLDITDKIDDSGGLNWAAPAGNWCILRFGYSLIGKTNHPATPEATGLEVDKLDSAAITHYYQTYLDKYKNAVGGQMGVRGSLQYVITDSWEAGSQNWTDGLLKQFEKRRGYSMIPWMPVLTGQVIKSARASENFLWDFRQTLIQMLSEYHYDQLTDILEAYGMKRYSESHEFMRSMLADGMDVKRRAAIPMGAMWMPAPMPFGGFYCHRIDDRESASVAHIYGQNIAAAESFTTVASEGQGDQYDPQALKPVADLELANGINRFVIHTSAHQPTDDKPGMTLGPCGQWFTRNQTWANQAHAWTDYLSRSAYLLQQGRFVADIVYYYGEDENVTSLFGNKLPEIPEGYNYDFINPDALMRLLQVKNGLLATPSGMRYRVLVLDENARRMSLPVLRKLRLLINGGAVVTGEVPVCTPSLTDGADEFKRIVDELWNTGKPNVFKGQSLEWVLKQLKIRPDFAYNKPSANTQLLYVHRKLPGQDIYWVNNREDTSVNVAATFRITGKVPVIWHPETGKTENVTYRIANNATTVDLHLTPADAVFVIFKDNTLKNEVVIPIKPKKLLASLTGNWEIHFQKDRGAPEMISTDSLSSWATSANKGIRYFSGTAAYRKTIEVPRKWLAKQTKIWLDLGEVKNLAEVFVNGKNMGIVWKKPFLTDISTALHPGKNKLEVRVTNLWVNRLIGDAQPDAVKKYTYTTWDFYNARSPLLPSGLLGPVKLIAE